MFAAVASLDPQFFQLMKIPSILHVAIQVIAFGVLMDERSHLMEISHYSFTCKGIQNDEHLQNHCYHAYNEGPNALQRWFVLITFIFPLIIIISWYLLIAKKMVGLKDAKCKFHAHYVYMIHTVLCVLFHLSIIVAVLICDFAYGTNKLIVDGNYKCLDGNSTIHCFDREADFKSRINITCFALQILLLLLLVTSLLFFCYQWNPKDADNDEDVCNICKYFLKKFSFFPGMYSPSSFLLVIF